MINRKVLISIIIIICCVFVQSTVMAQYDKFRGSYGRRAMKFGFGAAVGQAMYYGDIGAEANARAIPTKRLGYQFSIDQRFGEVTRYSSSFGIQLNYMMGYLEEEDIKYRRHLNFESKISQFELLAKIHLEKLLNFNRKSRFSPIIAVGFSYLSFNPMTDTLDANGNIYNYWPDNSLREVPYDWRLSYDETKKVERDKIYESELDPNKTFSHSTITFPMLISLEYSLTYKIRLRASMELYYSFNDNIDAKNNPGEENRFKDHYMYRSLALFYNLGKGGSAYKRKRYKSKF